jgi:hypothetical protein
MRKGASEGAVLFAEVNLTPRVLVALDLEVIELWAGQKVFVKIHFPDLAFNLAARSWGSGTHRFGLSQR